MLYSDMTHLSVSSLDNYPLPLFFQLPLKDTLGTWQSAQNQEGQESKMSKCSDQATLSKQDSRAETSGSL